MAGRLRVRDEMSNQNPLLSFDEDLVVLRQLKTAAERAEFTRLMKRAYTQHISACAFVQHSPERHVSSQIRRLCEAVLAQASAPPPHDP
jgi:hypothetical protein